MDSISPYALGATLYMPATRKDLIAVALRNKIPGLRSLVICLEDSVAETDVPDALRNLQSFLWALRSEDVRPTGAPLLFVRPRSVQMAAMLNDWHLIETITGFVIPKISLKNFSAWINAITNPRLLLMPTLETAEAFNPVQMAAMAEALKGSFSERILALRIGGNDLMGCLGIRRPANTTLYDSPMGYVISMLCGLMATQGFALTAPVFEHLSAPALLKREIALDIAHGLVGKTAIHPSQVPVIQAEMRVSSEDLESAHAIVATAAPAVFRLNNAMCEPATHYNWATKTIERAKWYGVYGGNAAVLER